MLRSQHELNTALSINRTFENVFVRFCYSNNILIHFEREEMLKFFNDKPLGILLVLGKPISIRHMVKISSLSCVLHKRFDLYADLDSSAMCSCCNLNTLVVWIQHIPLPVNLS